MLFGGRLYLYWGPVPARFLLPVKAVIGRAVIGDQFLVFALGFGALCFTALLLRDLWGRHFPDVPPWPRPRRSSSSGSPPRCPTRWLGPRSTKQRSSAASASCSPACTSPAAARRRRAAAGSRWPVPAGAGGGFAGQPGRGTGGAVRAGLLSDRPPRLAQVRRLDWPRLAALGLPMAAGALALAGYNQVRFANWHEFGQRFQLTEANYHDTPHLFQPANAVPGLYSYLLRPTLVHEKFPFFDARSGDGTFPRLVRLPEHYEYNEPIAGLLLVTPAVWLAALPVGGLLAGAVARVGGSARFRRSRRRGRRRFRSQAVPISIRPTRPLPTPLLLTPLLPTPPLPTPHLPSSSSASSSAALLGFAPIPFMLGSTMRYLCDLTPCLLILAAVGFWQRVRLPASGPRRIILAACGAWPAGPSRWGCCWELPATTSTSATTTATCSAAFLIGPATRRTDAGGKIHRPLRPRPKLNSG